jgi:acetyl-CoA acetyltransferase
LNPQQKPEEILEVQGITLATLMYEMIRRNVRYGLAALCQGGGMGSALILENPRA